MSPRADLSNIGGVAAVLVALSASVAAEPMARTYYWPRLNELPFLFDARVLQATADPKWCAGSLRDFDWQAAFTDAVANQLLMSLDPVAIGHSVGMSGSRCLYTAIYVPANAASLTARLVVREARKWVPAIEDELPTVAQVSANQEGKPLAPASLPSSVPSNPTASPRFVEPKQNDTPAVGKALPSPNPSAERHQTEGVNRSHRQRRASAAEDHTRRGARGRPRSRAPSFWGMRWW